MREILFRGKIKNIDELIGKGFLTDGAVNSISKWVYGVPIPRYPDLFLAWSEGNGEYEEITIIPKSITQHTGLTDKNGVKIFEGDIVKVYDVYCNETVVGVVEFCDGSFRIYDTDFTSYDRWMYCKVEVIGNVYDDVNLLET